MNPNRQLAGKKAQSSGATFELIFQRQAQRQRVHCLQMPDGCRQIGGNRLIRVPTPFDWILAFNGKSAYVDTKTFEHDRLRRSDLVPHQIEALYNIGWHCPAGYVVWFRKTQAVVFYSWHFMIKIGQGQSASQQEGILLGTIEDFSVLPILEQYTPTQYGDQTVKDFFFSGGK